MSDVPPHIQEFNTIAGLIFAQLYRTFPGIENIDRDGIARAIGVQGTDWSAHKLPSGRSFSETLSFTIGWLNAEGFTRAYGTHPAERVSLTTKGLMAMSAVPSRLQATVGGELTKAVEQAPASGPNLSAIGDLIGGVFGGFFKSLSS
jgi:hypothetical protein